MKGNESLYILMGIVLVIVAIELVMLLQFSNSISYLRGELSSGIHTTGNNNTSYNQNTAFLTISSSGTVSAVPSKAQLSVQLQGKGQTPSAAEYNLSKELTMTNATLMKYIEGNWSNVQTTYYQLYNQTGFYYTTYNGYVASEDLSVTIPSIGNVSSALGALSNINGVSVYASSGLLSDSQVSTLRGEALSQAMSNATAQAEALLPGKNFSVSNITVNSYPRIYPLPYALGTSAASAAISNTTSSPAFFNGTETVTESITVVFAYSK